MKKKRFVLHVSVAVALCATAFATPAAADDGPLAPPTPRPGVAPVPRAFAPPDALIGAAAAIVTTEKAGSEGLSAPSAPSAAPASVVPTPAPARAVARARSYPRTFSTYDSLIDYANSIATAEEASDKRLAEVTSREAANKAALATVFDPRVRGGLLRSPSDVIENATLQAIRKQLTNDAHTAQQLVADGAAVTTPTSWHLPLAGEDTQDFGPTSYYFEPALTYRGEYYPHFHTGIDLATAWGTPILAPADGVVVFAGMMGDGAEVVVMTHDSGLVSMYAHLDNRVFPVPVKAGDIVRAGDRIGNVGLTGNTTGAHLHWSVWRDGELIDPLSVIKSE